MEMGSVGVANVERAAGEVEVTGVDLELVAGNARGDGAVIAEKSAAALGVGVANVERAAGEVGVTGVDIGTRCRTTPAVTGPSLPKNPLPPWAWALPTSNEPPVRLR